MAFTPGTAISATAAAAAANASLLAEYGQVGGAVKQIWQGAPARSTNLFTVANLYQGSTLGSQTTALNKTTITPSVTANSTTQRLASRIILPQFDNTVNRYRITLTITATGTTGAGNFEVYVGARGNGAALTQPSGMPDVSVIQFGATDPAVTNFKTAFEVDYWSQVNGATTISHLDISLSSPNNVTAGTLTLNAVDVRQIEAITPMLWAGWDSTPAVGAHFYVNQPIGTKADGIVMRAKRDFGGDTVDFTYRELNVYPENSYQFVQKATTSNFGSFGPQSQIHVGNDNQVLVVYKADNVTTEFRGNTHGGETGASGTYGTDYTVFADYGDGSGWTAITDSTWNHSCYRVKVVTHTKMTRSDQGSPFVLVDTTYILYPDGTMRVDRTNTFQQAQKMSQWFYHMTSINPATNSVSRFLGRLGSGRRLLGPTVDFTDKVPAPVGGTHTTATTGGTIPASPQEGWSVKITSVTSYGESVPTDIGTRIVTTGATSTVTANWTAAVSPAAVNPKSYNVYFGYQGFEKFVGNVAFGTNTLLITAPPASNAASPPTKTTALTGVYTIGQVSDSPYADWSAILDPHTKSVYSLALDRDAIIAHTGVTGVRATIQMWPGSLAKNYWRISMTGGDGGGFPYTVPSGTVYTDTLWFFSYMPANVDRFEDEQTVRAANVKSLPALYPNA